MKTSGSNQRSPSRKGLRSSHRAHAVLLVIAGIAMAACGHSRDRASQVATQAEMGGTVALAVNGFNYTDLVISYFAVGAAGGGNLYVSSPTSGGGGTSCCVMWRHGTPLPQTVTVEWMRVVDGRDRWCEKTVQIVGPVPADATALGVHFMPDGEIQVEITKGYPKMKLRLENFDDGRRRASGNVIHDEKVARCRDGR